MNGIHQIDWEKWSPNQLEQMLKLLSELNGHAGFKEDDFYTYPNNWGWDEWNIEVPNIRPDYFFYFLLKGKESRMEYFPYEGTVESRKVPLDATRIADPMPIVKKHAMKWLESIRKKDDVIERFKLKHKRGVQPEYSDYTMVNPNEKVVKEGDDTPLTLDQIESVQRFLTGFRKSIDANDQLTDVEKKAANEMITTAEKKLEEKPSRRYYKWLGAYFLTKALDGVFSEQGWSVVVSAYKTAVELAQPYWMEFSHHIENVLSNVSN